MKVILIGYRATGKSTIGELLSRRLQIPFVDTDHLVEQAAGAPIPDIVAQGGWDAFRTLEIEALASLTEMGPAVVSTGGGVVLGAQNRILLKREGFVVWLQAPLALILSRLTGDGGYAKRPSLTGADLVSETTALLKERHPLYQETSDWTLDTAGMSIVQVADEIHQQLAEAGVVAQIHRAVKAKKGR